jgi:hypothetical protein
MIIMYNWVFRLCPSPGIPETRKHNLSETESHSTISRTVCPGFRPQSGPVTKFSSHSCMFVILWLPLGREDGSVIYCCCLVSPAQSLSGLSPAGQMTISCCPISEIPATWRAKSQYLYPPGTGWPSYIPGHWVPVQSPLTTRRATVVF